MRKPYHFEPFTIPDEWQGKYFGIYTVSQILASRRQQLAMTQTEVAERAHIRPSQYNRLESGERMLQECSMEIGMAICAALLLDPYQLLPLRVEQPVPEGELPLPQYVGIHDLLLQQRPEKKRRNRA